MDLRPLRPALHALRLRVRALYLLHGTGRTAAILGGLLVLSFLLDRLLEPPLAVRAIHGALSLGVLAWGIRRHLALPLRRSVADLGDEELALAIEARVPRLQDRLVGALQWERILAAPDCGESRSMMEASVAEAARAVVGLRAADLADPRPARRAFLLGAAAAGAVALGALAAGEDAAAWARRSLLLSDEPWPRRTTLVVLGFTPGEPRTVTLGEDLPVVVRVEGVVPDAGVLLRYQTLPGEGGRVERDARPMSPSADDPRTFGFVFHEVPGSFRFWVTGGDDDDGEPVHEVIALVPPAMESVTASLAFPAATGLPPETRSEGDLEVPEGTRIDFTARATVPLAAAALAHPATAPASPLAVDADGRTVRWTATVAGTTEWRLDMTGADGARSIPARNTRRITARPDPRPEVRMLLPVTRVFALPDARVPVKVLAKDNYSLDRLVLDVVPGRGREAIPVELAAPGAAAPGPGGLRPAVRSLVGYRLLDLPSLRRPAGDAALPGPTPGALPGGEGEDEVVIRAVATDNAGSTAASEPVAIQITDPAEMLRRLSQRQTRLREDLEALRRHLEGARNGARRAEEATRSGAPLPAADREALRSPAGLASRAVREAASLADDLGDVLLTYACNRLVENRVAADRVVSLADGWLRDEGGAAEPPLGPALWRRLAAARASKDVVDEGILGSLLDALALSDALASGPGAALRDGMDALAGGTTLDAAAASAGAVRSAAEALDLVRRIGLHLQEWESLHEILEATRSLLDQQEAIRRNLRGPSAPGTPEGR